MLKDIALILFISLASGQVAEKALNVIFRGKIVEAETRRFQGFEQIMTERNCEPKKFEVIGIGEESEMLKRSVIWDCSGILYRWTPNT